MLKQARAVIEDKQARSTDAVLRTISLLPFWRGYERMISEICMAVKTYNNGQEVLAVQHAQADRKRCLLPLTPAEKSVA